MSDDPQEDQVSDEEGTPVEEAVAEEEAEDKPLSAENLRAEIDEIGTRAKSAGLKPLRNMVQSYVNQTLDAVDGLLSALEGKGNKRKKGD